MADEISQVVEMEYKGVYYLFKGTKEAIATIVRVVKALHNWSNEKYLKAPGNCTWEKLQKISNGTPPLLEFPKEMFEPLPVGKDSKGNIVYGKSEFELYCEKYELRYCMMPDLNPYDDYIPVAVPAQDVGVHQEQIKAVMGRRIKNEEKKDKEYEALIRRAEEKIANATSDKERAAAEAELQMLKDAKAQNEKLLAESKEKADRDNVLDFAEYLKQGEGSLVEFNPKLALDQENCCGIVKEFNPYDCMWPVRDAELIPESKEVYYSQRTSDDKIHYIRRKFVEDEHGHIFSEYYVRIPGSSNEKVFSDYGLSQTEWEKQLPHVLKEAGLQNETPTAVVQSKDRFMKYQEFMEENFSKAQENHLGQEQEAVYSTTEARDFVEEHNEDMKRKKDFKDSQYTRVTVDTDRIMYDEEDVLCLQTKDGLLRGVMVDSMDERYSRIFIDAENLYAVKMPDGEKLHILGEDIIAKENSALKEIAQRTAGGRGR